MIQSHRVRRSHSFRSSYLATGDADQRWNMVALCPNCHAAKTRGKAREALRHSLRRVAPDAHFDAGSVLPRQEPTVCNRRCEWDDSACPHAGQRSSGPLPTIT